MTIDFRWFGLRNVWLWLILGSVVTFFFACWWFLAPEVPVEDDYDAILKYLLYPWPERLTHLADLHNEHRILTSRLVTEFVFALRGTFDFRLSILIGNFLQLSLASVCFWLFLRLGLKMLGACFFVLFLSLVHYDNSLNALCSVQNVAAMILPMAALLFCQSEKWFRFAMGLGVAVAATFTSGCGIFVWCAIGIQQILLKVSDSASWKDLWCKLRSQGSSVVFNRRMLMVMIVALVAIGFFFGLPDDRPVQVVKDVAQEGELLLAKTTVMGYAIEITPQFIIRHLAYAGNYFLSCLGGVVLVTPFTVLFGVLVFGAIVYLLMTLPRCQNTMIVGMLVYLLMTIASCAVFRASSFDSTIPSRYRIVCLSVFFCVLYLLSERSLAGSSWFAMTERLILVVFVLIAVCYSIRVWPLLSQRRQVLLGNFSCWPAQIEGLSYPIDRLEKADKIMREIRLREIYDYHNGSEHPVMRSLPEIW